MLIITAVNRTYNKAGHQVLHLEDGTSDYEVEVGINSQPSIFKGTIKGHVRDEGAAALLRRIADEIDKKEKKK